MNITEIRIRRVEGTANLRAVASVTFDDEFVVHDIKVFEGKGGPFVTMPDKKIGEGVYRDIAHPITRSFRRRLVREVLEKYAQLPAEDPEDNTTENDD
ncbi:MAG: septation regulator SpoVG [Clostridia bacterium]|nr:septation regulator SpoVG [Clostridia bacterium]